MKMLCWLGFHRWVVTKWAEEIQSGPFWVTTHKCTRCGKEKDLVFTVNARGTGFETVSGAIG